MPRNIPFRIRLFCEECLTPAKEIWTYNAFDRIDNERIAAMVGNLFRENMRSLRHYAVPTGCIAG